MSEILRELGQKAADRLNSDNPQTRRRSQTVIGLTFMLVFVVASFAVNQSVLALNQAAGNYGYYGGSYGYQASNTTSDDLPSAPTSLTSSSIGQTTATVSWTAPTTTVLGTAIATGGGSISSYKFHYSTSTLSVCSGGTSSTETGTSKAITGLTANTTYNVAVCATDNNTNDSSVLTGSFTTIAISGGGGGGGGGGSVFGGGAVATTTTVTAVPAAGAAAPAAAPVAPAAPAAGPTTITTVSAPTLTSLSTILSAIGVTTSTGAESQASTLLTRAIGGSSVGSLAAAVRSTVTNYVAYGNTGEARRIGAGERASIIENFSRVFGEVPTTDNDYRAAQGMIICESGQPCADLKAFRRAQVAESDFLAEFRRLNGRFPCEGLTRGSAACSADWQALEIMTYGYKPLVRNLEHERQAIRSFRAIRYIEDFRGTREDKAPGVNPSALGHWNAIRSAVYGNWAQSTLNPNR